jgi:hypothetical protein
VGQCQQIGVSCARRIRNPAGPLQLVGVSHQLHVFDAPLTDVANQITVDISDQVTQLERWQERELHVCSITNGEGCFNILLKQVTLRLPSPQSVTVTIPSNLLSPTSQVSGPMAGSTPSQHSSSTFSDKSTSHHNVITPHGQTDTRATYTTIKQEPYEAESDLIDIENNDDSIDTTIDDDDDATKVWMCHLCPDSIDVQRKTFAKKYSLKVLLITIVTRQF